MPRTAIDYKTPYDADSLRNWLMDNSAKTMQSCVLIVYGGSFYAKRTGDLAVDGVLKKITSTEDGLFSSLKAGDSIVVRGFNESENSGNFPIVSVSMDGRDVTLDADLADESGESCSVEIRDGIAIGQTTHDRDIVFNGITYHAAPGHDATAIQFSSGTEDDNITLSGAYNENTFTRGNILNGVYDDAFVEIFAINADAPDMGRYILTRGTLGQFELLDHGYQVEYNSLIKKYETEIGEVTSPTCRYHLGDSRCQKDLSLYIETGTVTYVESNRKFAVSIDTPTTKPAHLNLYDYQDYIDPLDPDDPATGANWYDWWFKNGTLTWDTCANSENEGVSFTVDAYDKITWQSQLRLVIELKFPPVYDVTVGDTFTIVAGCDKTFTHCDSKFDNWINFGGEPNAPERGVIMKVHGREI